MYGPVRFSIDGESYVLAGHHDAERLGSELQPVGRWEGQRLLARALQDDGARAVLRDYLGARSTVSGWDDHRLFGERLFARLFGGPDHFVLFRRPPSAHGPLLVDAPTEQLDESTADEAAAVTTWIEVVIVDEDGSPCPGVDYEVELSDGRMRQGKTNEHGIFRYEDLPVGTCKVWLVGPDDASWTLA